MVSAVMPMLWLPLVLSVPVLVKVDDEVEIAVLAFTVSPVPMDMVGFPALLVAATDPDAPVPAVTRLSVPVPAPVFTVKDTFWSADVGEMLMPVPDVAPESTVVAAPPVGD